MKKKNKKHNDFVKFIICKCGDYQPSKARRCEKNKILSEKNNMQGVRKTTTNKNIYNKNKKNNIKHAYVKFLNDILYGGIVVESFFKNEVISLNY